MSGQCIQWLHTVGEQPYIDLSNQSQFLSVGVMKYRLSDGTFVPNDQRTVILINDEWILTARHNYPGANTGVVTIAGRDYVTSGWVQYPVKTTTVPGYDPADATNGFDVALARLDRRCTNCVPMGLLQTDTSGGMNTTIVGYGAGGPGNLGQQSGSYKRRAGTNVLEDVGFPNTIWCDFDDGTAAGNSFFSYTGSSATPTPFECQLGNGDSGGPATVQVNGQTVVAAINLGIGTDVTNGNPTVYGSYSAFSKVFPTLPWISTTTNVPGKVAGKVTLASAIAGSTADLPITIEVRNVGSSTALESRTVQLSPDGSYSFVSPLRGNYALAFKGDRWLRSVTSTMSIQSAQTDGVNITLTPGDVNGDNTINLTDFSQLSSAYGATPASPFWNAHADLNLDGTVNLVDFSLLSTNYGKSGSN